MLAYKNHCTEEICDGIMSMQELHVSCTFMIWECVNHEHWKKRLKWRGLYNKNAYTLYKASLFTPTAANTAQ